MPFTADAPPSQIENLPKAAQAIWISAFNSAFRAIEGTEAEKEAAAFKVAWAAVGKKFMQTADGKWVEKSVGAKKRAFIAGERIVVEMNDGLDGDYSSLSYKPIDAGLGVFMNEGSAEDGTREAVALYFLVSSGWTVARAVKWARDWASGSGEVVKRVGIEVEERSPHFAPIHRGRLAKAVANPELAAKHIAFAEVLVPWEVDTQGDILTPEDIENAAYRYMENPIVGIMHAEWGDVGTVVENFITREGDPDFQTPGSWVMGVKFTDKAWQKILNNELTGLSIGGFAEQEEILTSGVR